MRHLNSEQDIAANSPTVVPTPQIFTPVEESNVTLQAQSQPGILDLSHSTTQTQTQTQTQITLPSQPNVDLTTTEKPPQLPPLTLTIITPDAYHNSETTLVSGVSTTTPPLGNESTLMRQSLNTEQDIAANSPTVVPTPQTFTPVEESDVAHNVTIQPQSQPGILDLSHSTTQTQTTLPSQPNVDLTTTDKPPQLPPLSPTIITPDAYHNSETTLVSGVSTTTPPLGNESTLMRQSLNTEQDIAANSPTVVPTPQTFTPVEESDVAHNVTIQPQSQPGILDLSDNVTAQRQTTQPSQPELDSISIETSLQNAPVLPTVIPGGSTTTPSTLGDKSTVVQRDPVGDFLPTTSHALISSSIGQEIVGRQSLSRPTFLQAYTKENSIKKVGKHSEQYSLPNLVFQQSTPATSSPSQAAPSQWSSVEELLGASANLTTGFDLEPVKFSRENSKLPTVSKSPKTNTIRRKSVLPDFANAGEVTAPDEITSSNEALPADIDTEAQPVTETIKSFCCSPPTENKIADEIETLAREIYNRLRERLKIERERYGHGIYSGRLPW